MAASVRHVDSDGATSIVFENWPDAFAGDTQTAKKFAVENNGDRPLGASPGPASGVQVAIQQLTGDGYTMLRIGADTDTLSPPYGLAAAAGGAGGLWPGTGTRGWVVTAFNGVGETIASFEVTFEVTDTSKKVTLTWTEIPGANGYNLWRTEIPGTYASPALRATLGATGMYSDDGDPDAFGAGIPLDTGAPPVDNTTGGAGPDYGTPPALGTDPLTFDTLFIGQHFFYWTNRVILVTTPEAGNPRSAAILVKEF